MEFKIDTDDFNRLDEFLHLADTQIQAVLSQENHPSIIIKESLEQLHKQKDDLLQHDRKLRIAIAGPIKAGKSTFLNNYLFEGKKILPTHATPKTAVLTRIVFDETPSLAIEFFTKSEWDAVVQKAQYDDANDIMESPALEIMDMVNERELDTDLYIGTSDYKTLSNYEELIGTLNDYVGNDGIYTPLVKMVTLGISNEEMKDLEIYDTPGLNDPVLSRNQTTRNFMKQADVVFFLSQSSKFLSESDLNLLALQFPQDGVSNLQILGSQIDSAIYQSLGDSDSKTVQTLDDLFELKIRTLKNDAEKKGQNLAVKIGEKRSEILKKSLSSLLFFSSMALGWDKKDRNDFSADEEYMFSTLINQAKKTYGSSQEISDDLIHTMACRKAIALQISESRDSKESIINERLSNLIPNIRQSVLEKLKTFRKEQQERLEILQEGDIQVLIEGQKSLESQINQLGEALEEELQGLAVLLQSRLSEVLGELQSRVADISKVQTQTGSETRTRTEYYTVTRGWWIFKRDVERSRTVSYTSNYNYATTADSFESLMNLSGQLTLEISRFFSSVLNPQKIKLSLKKKILGALDTTKTDFNPSFYKLTVEDAMNSLELPTFQISPDSFFDEIESSFSGEIRDDDLIVLQNTVLKCGLQLFKDAAELSRKEAAQIKSDLGSVKTGLQDKILESSRRNLNEIKNDMKTKEESKMKYENIIKTIQNIEKGLIHG